MSNIKNLIIVEDVFNDILAFLPGMKFDDTDINAKIFNVRFAYGDTKELNAFLKLTENETVQPYPLIWLIYPNLERHQKTKVELPSVSLVVAVNTTKAIMNPERIETTYKKVLMPLASNIVTLFTKANIINMKHEFNITKYPNYSDDGSNGTANFTTSIWDAIKINFSCDVINNCLNNIKL